MFMFHFIRKSLKTAKHHPRLGGLEILKYIGPGLLVTVGFIDPGIGLRIWQPVPIMVIPFCGWYRCLRSC